MMALVLLIVCVLCNILSIFSSELVASSRPSYTTKEELPLDDEGHLAHNIILVSNMHGHCIETIDAYWEKSKYMNRQVVSGNYSIIKEMLGSADVAFACAAVCLHKGMRSDHLAYPILEHIISFSEEEEGQTAVYDKLDKWSHKACQAAEIGFVSNHPNNIDMYWVSNDERHHVGDLQPGEKHTIWHRSTLGHVFHLVDSVTDDLVGEYEVLHNAIYHIGPLKTGVSPTPRNVSSSVQSTLANEWERSKRVTRTFSELGFTIGRMPNDLWASIATYYYNNKNNLALEEWDSKGLFVNHWEVDVFMIGMPWGLKKFWQDRLRSLVEIWSGETLELTDIYGMRRYEEGARLLTHVDREATHAASLIINIAQSAMRKPWYIEVYDFANRLHKIPMNEGDIVYYESAKSLHGRMEPLEGMIHT